jgi:hypothetical protein
VEVANALTNSWCFDHVAMELSWTLPTGKSDHMALGTVRTWGCLCAVPDLCCPYHLALEHWSWLAASPFLKPGVATPLFPSVGGGASSKIAVVATFEALGSLLGQPLFNATGVRLFGGHSPRVTGAQALAAAGIEINKIRILARHSGETILRYVAEAPLKSLRSDLRLIAARSFTGSASGSNPRRDDASGVLSGSTASSPGLQSRVRLIEAALVTLRSDLTTQAQDVVSLATGFARTDDRVFVQNTITATVHLALQLDGGHAACGWRFSSARRPVNGPAFRVIRTVLWWACPVR